MMIAFSANAKDQFTKTFGSDPVRLLITDGCCGKSFAFEQNAQKSDEDTEIIVEDVVFLAPQETQQLAPEVYIEYPGPIDGFLVTNKAAIGGCACGRSFFVEA